MLRELIVLIGFSIGAFYSIRSAFGALALYLATAYFRPEQWVWSDRIAQLNLSLIAGVILICSTLWHERRLFRFNGPLIVVALFFLQTLISTTVSETPDWSWKYWQEFAKVMLVSCLIPVIVSTPARLRATFVVIALALGLEAAKQGFIGVLTGADRNSNEHPMLGDNNGVALAMMMLLPMIGALSQTSTNLRERLAHRLLFAGVLVRGMLTYSRGGFLAAGAVVFFHVVRSRHRVRVLAMVIVACAVLFPMLPSEFWNRMETIGDAPEVQDSSAQGRLHFWGVAVDMAAARPLTGVGVNGFQTSYNDYDSSLGAYGRGRAVHSTWFGLLGELGWVGLCLFLAVLFSAFAACRAVRRASKTNPEAATLLPFATAIEGSLIAYVVAGTFLNAQYFEMFWHLVGLSIAIGILATRERSVDFVESAPAVAVVEEPMYSVRRRAGGRR